MALANQKELAKAEGKVTTVYEAGITVVNFNANITVQLPPEARQRIIDALNEAFRRVVSELGLTPVTP
jgi:tripartite-type tricarboxylate transporter receptor subunit TctC